MLFEITVSAKSEYAKLTMKEQKVFKEAVGILNAAADRFVATWE